MSRRRCIGLFVVLGVGFGAVAVRLGQLQVLDADGYAARGIAQRTQAVSLAAPRGSIVGRNGEALALSVPMHTIVADPALVDDPDAEAAALAPILGRDVRSLAADLRGEGRFVYLARKVDDSVAAAVEDLNLAGIQVTEESARVTPAGSVAAGVIGRTDLDSNGVSGLERQYQGQLAGTAGSLLVERGKDGETIASGKQQRSPATRGDDLELTIDRSLQYSVEQALIEAVGSTGSQGGIVVVSDPATGEILAMANARAGTNGPEVASDNMALTMAFEPGSVSKVITMAGALEKGTYGESSVLNVPDSVEMGTYTFTDDHAHDPVDMTLNDIITQSSNVGTIEVARSLGQDTMHQYLVAFGLGQDTGLGFPDESSGIVADTSEWTDSSMGSIPIGQGFAVNAVQLLEVYNTIANDGVYVPSTLVSATVDADGTRHPVERESARRVVSSETATTLTRMLESAVSSPDGTGGRAAIDGYSVAGKTGTARKPCDDGTCRGYEPGAYVATFAGYLPAENPRLSVVVILDEPRGEAGYYASQTAAPLFAEVAEYALRRFDIPPTGVAGTEPLTSVGAGSLTSAGASRAGD